MLSNMKDTMSTIFFDFGSYSYRDTFFSTSYYQINFGFLTQPAQTYKTSKNNFRCRIFENVDGVLTLSNKWSHLDLSSFSAIRLYPKAEFTDPSAYTFTMGCYGAGVPTSASNMQLFWIDNGAYLQTAN